MGILHPSQTLYQLWNHWTSLTPSQASIISSNETALQHSPTERPVYLYISGYNLFILLFIFQWLLKKITEVCVYFQAP